MAVSEKMVEAALDAAEFVPYQWREMPFAVRWQARMRRALEAAEAVRGGDAAPRWRHKKRGTVYTEVGRAELQVADENSPFDPMLEGATLVIYRGDDRKMWARHEPEFDDGRFERLDHIPDAGKMVAAPPAGTVAVRVAVAFDEDGGAHVWEIDGPLGEEGAWARLRTLRGAPLRSCIATIHAPLRAVPEVGAVVEDPTP